ncbi:hypothetical protein F5141DRAFT_1200871 [Pisolithus sp. B1]|nr:hypothetical protein F5141DRAFT_1200871 [Pisolithus sp. B1]
MAWLSFDLPRDSIDLSLIQLAPVGNWPKSSSTQYHLNSRRWRTYEDSGNYLNFFVPACESQPVSAIWSQSTGPFTVNLKRSSGPTPQPFEHPSHSSFEDARQYFLTLMNESNRTARAAVRSHEYSAAQSLRCPEKAWHRDNNHCMLTGDRYQDGSLVWVEIAHIIPEVTNKNNIEEGKKYLRHLPSCQLKKPVQQFHSASAWTTLSTFTDVNVLGELAGNRIHRLEYIMSTEQASYRAFNELVLWLRPMEWRIFPFAHFLISVDRVHETRIVHTKPGENRKRECAFPIL